MLNIETESKIEQALELMQSAQPLPLFLDSPVPWLSQKHHDDEISWANLQNTLGTRGPEVSRKSTSRSWGMPLHVLFKSCLCSEVSWYACYRVTFSIKKSLVHSIILKISLLLKFLSMWHVDQKQCLWTYIDLRCLLYNYFCQILSQVVNHQFFSEPTPLYKYLQTVLPQTLPN